jgi:hypothetical protein
MLTDFITPSTNLIHLSLTGSTPETVLKDLLDKVSLEKLENLLVSNQGTQEIYRLDDQLYNQTIYRLTYTTPSTAQKLDPDGVV